MNREKWPHDFLFLFKRIKFEVKNRGNILLFRFVFRDWCVCMKTITESSDEDDGKWKQRARYADIHSSHTKCVKSNIGMRGIVIKIYSFTVFNYPHRTHTHKLLSTRKNVEESEEGTRSILNFLCIRDDDDDDDVNRGSGRAFSIKFYTFFFVLIYFHCIWRWGQRRLNGAIVVANDDMVRCYASNCTSNNNNTWYSAQTIHVATFHRRSSNRFLYPFGLQSERMPCPRRAKTF